ncbi:hypothetical protein C5B96_13955 [Subtercola sp. Z020]|uniref:hypothetical protein n=1 Tax=Subtercola sp. Z020 TaxID=2080582 RepID=UPI000CE7BE20|nr:hypothetical protein [Subtercola sp. Z020]PPF78932.1 hypothetical protein C5B96_13955 [Subtercola sp. Z020]
MIGGWLRRNGLALAAVVVLVPLTVGITFSNEWISYYAERPSQPVVVGAGAAADFAGTGWRIEGSRRIAADSAEGADASLPAGSQLVVVTVGVTPRELDDEGTSPFCEVRLQEAGGGELARSWGDASFEPIDYRVSEEAETACTSELTTPYRFEALFVIPAEVDTALVLRLEVVEELPRYLALTL